jgi:hypothetical protein
MENLDEKGTGRPSVGMNTGASVSPAGFPFSAGKNL